MSSRIKRLFEGFSLKALGLAVLSGLLLALASPPHDIWWLIFVGFVPLFVALEGRGVKGSYWLSVLCGSTLVWIGFSWLPFTVETFWKMPPIAAYLFSFAFGLFVGQAFALTTLLVRWLGQRQTWMPRAFLWAFAFVGIWALYPMILRFNLSNALHTAPFTLQGISLFGSESADCTIVLTNYALYALLRRHSLDTPRRDVGLMWAWIVLWFGFGVVSFQQWKNEVESWSRVTVGMLQTHRESTAKRLPPEPGYSRIYPIEIAMSERLAKAGAEVIVFPEGHKFGYFKELHVRRALHEAAHRMQADLLLHDKGLGNLLEGSETPTKRNSTILLRRNGEFGGIYHKRKLVPFGEYYPIIGHNPEWIQRLGLYKPMAPGEDPVHFEVAGMKVQTLICYETVFGHFVAESMGYDGKGKVLSVQTNDGWYGGGAQTAQHRSYSVLRAIENRIPLIQAINDGQSHVVTPDGQYLFVGAEWTRAEYAVDMPYNAESGGTFYTRWPFLFLSLVWGLLGLFILNHLRLGFVHPQVPEEPPNT